MDDLMIRLLESLGKHHFKDSTEKVIVHNMNNPMSLSVNILIIISENDYRKTNFGLKMVYE